MFHGGDWYRLQIEDNSFQRDDTALNRIRHNFTPGSLFNISSGEVEAQEQAPCYHRQKFQVKSSGQSCESSFFLLRGDQVPVT